MTRRVRRACHSFDCAILRRGREWLSPASAAWVCEHHVVMRWCVAPTAARYAEFLGTFEWCSQPMQPEMRGGCVMPGVFPLLLHPHCASCGECDCWPRHVHGHQGLGNGAGDLPAVSLASRAFARAEPQNFPPSVCAPPSGSPPSSMSCQRSSREQGPNRADAHWRST